MRNANDGCIEKVEKCTYAKVKSKKKKSYRHWNHGKWICCALCQAATADDLRMLQLWDLDTNSAIAAFLHTIRASPNGRSVVFGPVVQPPSFTASAYGCC